MDKRNCNNCTNAQHAMDRTNERCKECRADYGVRARWEHELSAEDVARCWEDCKRCGWFSTCGIYPPEGITVEPHLVERANEALAAYGYERRV